jgi:luciferase family oxidoreductase group 1
VALKLSIVDQSPVPSGVSPARALSNTIDLARLADRLGYTRYWIAEHHAMPGLASPAPEVLVARLGAETSRIRIGSGGVLLPHYAPLKIAEQFRMLHALYPGRVDLGVGRAPGGTALEVAALREGRTDDPGDEFPTQLLDLLAYLKQRPFPSGHRFARVHVAPDMPGGPDVWLLGSSLWSAEAAALIGVPYAFAHFINPEPTRRAIEHYRSYYVGRPEAPVPRAIVALGVICAGTEAEAERLFLSSRLMFRRLRLGDLRAVPTVEEAEREFEGEPAGSHDPVFGPFSLAQPEWPRYVVGDLARVKATLTAMAESLAIDELMVVTITHDHQARRRSYELLAEGERGQTPVLRFT